MSEAGKAKLESACKKIREETDILLDKEEYSKIDSYFFIENEP